MNEFLAEMYGTRETIGAPSQSDEVEKLAEANLLDQALTAEGVDIDTLPAETILKVAYELFGEDSHLVKAAAQGELQEGEQEGDEDFQTKVAQADFLGRVMAHSYVNEMNDMEKDADGKVEAVRKGLGAAYKAVKGAPAAYVKSVKERARIAKLLAYKGGVKGYGKAGLKARAGYVARGAKKLAPELGAAGALGAGGTYAAMKDKKKESSALDTLAEKRAMDWAAEHGLLEQETEPEEEKLASAVNQRAYQMLLDQGIDVDAIEAAA